MPNHVTNVLEFECNPPRFLEILERIRIEGEPLGSVDFNKLIPMPESLNIESSSRGAEGKRLYESYLKDTESVSSESEREKIRQTYLAECGDSPETFLLGKEYHDNLEKYGAENWYDWRYEHWGTKWNAYNWIETDPDTRCLSFDTAWSSVPELVRTLSEAYPEVKIRYSWSDEDYGYNVGVLVFKDGFILDRDIPQGGTRHAYAIAADVHGYDIREFEDEIRANEESARKPGSRFRDDR